MADSNTQTILIVDDHVENLSLLSSLLKPHYRIRAATSGQKAIELARTIPAPDLILLDVMMPGVDGYQVCKRLKANPQTREIPVIFLTARTQPEDEARGFEVGAVDYVAKPIHPPLLLARVRAQLALAELLNQTRQELNASSQRVIHATRERDEQAAYADYLAREIAERERAEAALRESQARFVRLTNGLQDQLVFFAHTLDGTLLYCSEGIHLLGISQPGQIIGKRWTDIIDWLPESLIRGEQENHQLQTHRKRIAELELSYQHPDGDIRHLMIHEYRVHDAVQDLDLIEGVAIDITKRKKQEAQLRTLLRAVEQAQASIVISDQDGTVLYVNPYFSEITGYAREDAIGQNPRVLKSGEHDADFYRAMWETLTSGQTWRGEIINRNKHGELFWEFAAISPIFDDAGRIVNYVAVKEDIGDRKALERIKEDVEQMMRHDLKTPLNAIVGLPQIMECDANLTDGQRELLGLIRDAGEKMVEMINLSLDLFKMETGCYDYLPEPFDLLPLLSRLIRIVETLCERRQVTIRFAVDGGVPAPDAHLIVCADARLLFSLLSNLLINAIEASSAGETVIIALQHQQPLILSIHNQGTVPAAIRSHFFEKYKTYGKRGGTGLGTYSAKLMADVMGLELGMETSDADNSTCLHLHLPQG